MARLFLQILLTFQSYNKIFREYIKNKQLLLGNKNVKIGDRNKIVEEIDESKIAKRK